MNEKDSPVVLLSTDMIEKKENARLSLFFFSFSLFSLLLLPRLLSYGVGFDGLHFASVARNMAEGYGSIWKPAYTEILLPVEYEHPPVGFFIQSLAFRLFGDGRSVELLYSGICGFVTFLLTALIWRRIFSDTRMSGSWFPVFLFAITPSVSRLFASNVLESILTPVILAACYFYVSGAKSEKVLSAFVRGGVAGILLVLSVGIKAHAGLFVITLVPLLALSGILKKKNSIVCVSGSAVSFFLVFTFFYLFVPESVVFFRHFLERKLAYALRFQSRIAVHPDALAVIPLQLLLPFIFALSLRFFFRLKTNLRMAVPFLLCAMAGSVPYFWTGLPLRYLLPSLPFYAMGISTFVSASVFELEQKLAEYEGILRIRALSVFICAVFFMILDRNSIRGDINFHKDIGTARTDIPSRALIEVCPYSLMVDWPIIAAMQRYYRVSLTTPSGQKLVLTSDISQCSFLNQCRQINAPEAKKYSLFQCEARKP